jgi:hypothetical protein
MSSWSDVAASAPELASAVRARFEAHGLGLMASLRRDGAPRISGIEFLFAGTGLWLGMMTDSLKAKDLLRDPRIALHNATVDKDVVGGDAKIAGSAIAVTDDQTFAEYRAAFEEHAGYPPPPGDFHLFRIDVTEISMMRPAGDHLVIEWWTEAGGVRSVDRY